MTRKIQHEVELPVVVEGFVETYKDVIDETERGLIRELVTYLGCPIFDLKPAPPGWRRLRPGNVTYDMRNDISHILSENHGRFLRITVEAIGIGNGAECDACKERFKCLTTKMGEG